MWEWTKFSRNIIWDYDCISHSLTFIFLEQLAAQCCLYFEGLHCRCSVTLVSSVCEALLRSLFWVPRGLNELPKMNFKFHFNMIGKRQWLFEQASHGAYPNRGPEHMVFIKNSSSGERCKLTGEYFKRGSMSE